MVRRKQTVSKEHADVLRQWKQRGFLTLDFEYEELTSHYMEQLNKAAKNLAGSIYEEHHKGEKVRIYRETTVMTNEEQSMTSKCLLLQSGQNQYSEEARQHLLQKYSSETVMATSKVNSLSSFKSVLFCLDNVPETYGKRTVKRRHSRIIGDKAKQMCRRVEMSSAKDNTLLPGISFDLIAQKEMKAGIFFYVAAARLVLGEPILLIRPTEHTSGTSTPYYTFDVEYCIPEDRNIPIQDIKIRLLYNGWNHFTPFFPQRVAEIIRKG